MFPVSDALVALFVLATDGPGIRGIRGMRGVGFGGSGDPDLAPLVKAGYVTEIYGLVASGKEADVILAYRDGFPLIVKRYRLYRTFKRRAAYGVRTGRVGKTRRGLGLVSRWADREYRSLLRCHRHGVPVPTPVSSWSNLTLMSMIGDTEPAPRLRDARRVDWADTATQIYSSLCDMVLRAEIVHGDLSLFNVLLHQDRIHFIDFPQSLDLQKHSPSQARPLLQRDIKNTLGQIGNRHRELFELCRELGERVLSRFDRHFHLEGENRDHR